ncbi:MAG: hypothetical protein ACE5KX_02545 [Acidimicrobiia bacterium]
MRIRCGNCRVELDAPGEGRFVCPACGATNEVRRDQSGSPSNQERLIRPHEANTEGGPPPPRITCPECEFRFIVGKIDIVTCPNCNARVTVAKTERAQKNEEATT